ncbi:S8 family serine peptidase [Lederbergia citrea]|uniref:S8 family serine peptidase n=1 Tax=Lederbergia citrea TaxID=2833581 RepID=A0A942UN10_9BACI|nr:S8 family serine peptidase [Lederbergia citrea]MBS4222817.1 S8 family serine peptidase [Lederbergia citrea]
MRHRLAAPFLLVLFSFFLSVSIVSAEEIQVEPEISKFSTNILFDDKQEYKRNELIVKFKSSVTSSQKKKILQNIKGKEVSQLLNGEFSLVSVPDSPKLVTIAEKLLKNKEVEFVEPNYEITKAYTPSDPGYKSQWHLKKIQAPKAWDITKGSSAIKVAVIDTGVQTNHPDLKGKIVSAKNITGGSPQQHGTHVAGTIAASINKKGVVGVAPNVKIMPINVFYGSSAYTDDIVEGIVYAADKGADVINMSLGSYGYSYYMDVATAYAKSKGAIIIAAAGNDDTSMVAYPAGLSSVLAISATNQNDYITSFSNYGSHIALAAPGQGIYSTVSGSTYAYMDGTSMAAPVVSGVAALVLSKNPILSPDQVETILEDSADYVGSYYFYGYGRVNAHKALKQTPIPISNLSLSTTNFTVTGKSKNNITFTASKGATVSVYVQNSKGKTIRKLATTKNWKGGKYSTAWDGKQDNGLFVESGSFSIVGKVSNGKKSITKKKTIKVTNKIKLVVKIGSSAIFSPKVKSKLTVSYEINKTAKVTAKIYDSKNKLVKTILNNKSLSPGKRTVAWDGKNSHGKLVKDGTYKLTVSGIDSNKVEANKTMSIKIDTVKPTAATSVLATPFKLDGKSKPGVKVTVKETVKVSAYVTTDKGVKIKRLTNNKSYNKGPFTLNWNGKNDKGKYVGEGKYRYEAEVKDAAGNTLVAKSKVFSLQDWQKPTIKSTADFYYRNSGNALYAYSISKPGKVTVQILKDGKVVRNVESGIQKAGGSQKFTWDGKDDAGNLLADGKYRYKINLVDKYKLTGTYTGAMTVALTKVVITHPGVVQFYDIYYDDYDYASEVYYKLSQDADVTVEIYDSYNSKVRTLNYKSRKAGINSFKWDGLDKDRDYAWDNTYSYKIIAKNSGGNLTTVNGKMTNKENPSWLNSHKYLYTYIGSDKYYCEYEFEINVNKPVSTTLYVYDFWSDSEVYKKTYPLKKGENVFNYKEGWDDVYYKLQYKDDLGNKYYYALWDLDNGSYSIKQNRFTPKPISPSEKPSYNPKDNKKNK